MATTVDAKAGMIEAIAGASEKLFGEIGQTVRQLGGKRQKQLQSAHDMHLVRMQNYNKEKREPTRILTIAVIIFAVIVVVALIIKR